MKRTAYYIVEGPVWFPGINLNFYRYASSNLLFRFHLDVLRGWAEDGRREKANFVDAISVTVFQTDYV